jgi:hypothetical protein
VHCRDTRRTPRTQCSYLHSETGYASPRVSRYVRPSQHVNRPLIRHLIAVYQPFMLLALKRWFPDFESHVLALGGMIKPYDLSACFSGLVFGNPAYIQPEARCLPIHPNIPREGKVPHSFYLSRVLFEPLLRRLVKERYPGVRFLRGTATGIVLDTDMRRVTEVEYTSKSGGRVTLPCALFVDCAGMARMGVKWLRKAGLSPPKVITYNPQLRSGFSEYFGFIWHISGLITDGVSSPPTYSVLN